MPKRCTDLIVTTKLARKVALGAVLLGCVQGIAPAQTPTQILQQIETVFVIPLENHNFTQPNPTSSPQQIKGNPAALFVNSLITPGNLVMSLMFLGAGMI